MFSVLTRIYLFRIDKVFLHLPFRLCLDHSLKELRLTTSLLFNPAFPLFCECKDTHFSFPSNTFTNFFSLFLNYFYFDWLPMCYIMKNIQISVILLRFYVFFRLFCFVLGPIWMKKYHKIQKTREKQNGFSTFFLSQQAYKTTGLQGKVQQRILVH